MAQESTNSTWVDGGLGDTNGAGKPSYIQLISSKVTLASASTTIGVKSAQDVESFKNYVFEVFGTATSFALYIEVVGPSGVARTINKVWDELNNGFLPGSDITTAGFYSVSVPAFTSIQVNITAISGGNVSVKGSLSQ